MIDSENPAPIFNKGWILLIKLGEYRESIKCFDRTLELIPDDYFSFHYKGVALRILGELVEALDSFDHALMINENEAITFVDKGDTFKEMGNDKEAMECYNEACKVMKKGFYED